MKKILYIKNIVKGLKRVKIYNKISIWHNKLVILFENYFLLPVSILIFSIHRITLSLFPYNEFLPFDRMRRLNAKVFFFYSWRLLGTHSLWRFRNTCTSRYIDKGNHPRFFRGTNDLYSLLNLYAVTILCFNALESIVRLHYKCVCVWHFRPLLEDENIQKHLCVY